jgi:hypothetical protein
MNPPSAVRVASGEFRGVQAHGLIKRNPRLLGFRSLDGTSRHEVGDWFEGDPGARARGEPTSLAAEYLPDFEADEWRSWFQPMLKGGLVVNRQGSAD